MIQWGGPLTSTDYANLQRSWITPELAGQARLIRVSSAEGAEMVGRRNNDTYSGIAIPYIWPGEDHVRDYWLRRDRPDIEIEAGGHRREKAKYLGPPGRGNRLYLVPCTAASLLSDVSIPVAITEGVKKTLALYRLAFHELPDTELPRFLPVGLAGVWGFRGVVGKSGGPNGDRDDDKGLIPDFSRLAWTNRKVFVVYDSNVHTNNFVAAARRNLTTALIERGAKPLWVDLPK